MKLEFEYEGTEYKLEYCRATIKLMERSGFKITELGDRPMTMLPELFRGAFLMHHKGVKQETIDEIFECLSDKTALLGKLGEMYNEPYEALLAEPAKGKKVAWTVK